MSEAAADSASGDASKASRPAALSTSFKEAKTPRTPRSHGRSLTPADLATPPATPPDAASASPGPQSAQRSETPQTGPPITLGQQPAASAMPATAEETVGGGEGSFAYPPEIQRLMHGHADRPYVPERFAKALPTDESFVAALKCTSKDRPVFLILTENKYYKVSEDGSKKTWGRDLWEIQEVDFDGCNNALIIRYHCKWATEDSYVKSRKLLAEDVFDGEVFTLVLRARLRCVWQQHLEERIIRDPEIYQLHLYVTHYDSRGKRSLRCLALSDTHVYALSVRSAGAAITGTKWRAPIAALVGVLSDASGTSLSLRFAAEAAAATDGATFCFCEESERDRVLWELRRLHHVLQRPARGAAAPCAKAALAVESVGGSAGPAALLAAPWPAGSASSSPCASPTSSVMADPSKRASLGGRRESSSSSLSAVGAVSD